MRLAVCALSAVLLSGCSWLGLGGSGGAHCAPGGAYYGGGSAGACGVGGGYGLTGSGYGADAGYGAGYGAGMYGTGAGAGYGAGMYGAGAGYGVGAGGYGAGAGYGIGAGGYGAGAGYGTGAYGTGAAGYGTGMYGTGYGAGGTTTLGMNAPYGSAAYGTNVVGTQYSNGQFVNGAGVQTVQGAPIYVPQPYPSYYGVPQLRGVGGLAAAALPFGLGLAVGNEFGIGGDVFGEKESGPADGGGGEAGAIDAIGYDDAFGNMKTIGGTAEYDVSRDMTVLGTLQYGQADGKSVSTGSFTPGTYDSSGHFTPTVGGVTRNLTGEFSDLETYTVEGGLRKYVGHNPGFRPYVGATGGFTKNNSVTLTQVDDTGLLFNEGEFIESGWNPTASAVLGSEMAIGSRAAIGIESGVRWTDALNIAGKSATDRWSVPVKLRGRVAF